MRNRGKQCMKICTFCNWEVGEWESSASIKFCGRCGQPLISTEDTSTQNSFTLSSDLYASDNEETLASENTKFISPNNRERTDTSVRRSVPNLPNTPIPAIPDEEIEFVPFQGTLLAQSQLYTDQVPYEGIPYIYGPPTPIPPISPPPPPPLTSHPTQRLQSSPSQRHATTSPSTYSRKQHRSIRLASLAVVIAAFIALCILGVVVAFFPKPTPTPTPTLTPVAQLVGEPIPGQKMILHGDRFTPGETVIILIDYNTPTAFSGPLPANSMRIGGLFFQHTAPPTGIKEVVGANGTFSYTLTIDLNWPVGSVHTVYVYKQDGKLIKLPSFTVITPTTSTGLIGCLDDTDAVRIGPIAETSTQPITRTIPLCAVGSGQINWTAHWDQKWLTLPSSGQVPAPQGGMLTLSASAKGLKPGSYTTTILFSSRQSNTSLPLNVVLMIVKSGSTGPQISLPPVQGITCVSAAPQSLSFTSVANQPTRLSKNVNITNCGASGKLSSSITTNDGKSWLGITPAQGTISSAEFQGVSITVSSAALAPGEYAGKITFQIGSSNAEVDVMFTVRQRTTPISCIDASPQSLTFVGVSGQNDPPSKSLLLTNCGATAQWSILPVTNDGTDWLHSGLYSHALNEGGRQQINVGVSSAYLQKGVYSGALIVSMGSNSVKINITFIVQAACLHVDYPVLVFKSNVGEGALQNIVPITNCGDAGSWYASTDDDAHWLSIDRNSGRLSAGASQRIAVDVSGAHLHEGVYTGNILFIMGTSTVTVQVKFIIVKPTIICISTNANALAFTTFEDENPDSQIVTIGNCGNTTEIWTASLHGTAWLRTDVSKGTLKTGDAQDIRVLLVGKHFVAGMYTGHITFSTSAGTKDVQVTLTVHKRLVPCITVNPVSLAFSSTIVGGRASTPTAQKVQITNCGDAGSLSATPSTNDGAPWLVTTPTTANLSPAATSNVTITVNSSGLSIGSYTATIPFTITVNTGARSVVNVRVQLSVVQQTTQHSLCTVSPSALTFTSTWGQLAPSAQHITLTNCSANDTWTESDGSLGMFNLATYSGILNNSGSQTVSITPTSSALAPGQYTYPFTFTTGSGEITSVIATWNVRQPPNPICIQANSSSLRFPDQSGNTSGVVSFSNCGAFPGNITVTGSTTSWLTVGSYGSGSFPTGYGPSIFVNTDSTNLSPGLHSGTITATITTRQGAKSVSLYVTYMVPTPPPQPPSTPVPTPTSTSVVPTDTPTDTPIVATNTPTDTPVPATTPTDTPVLVTPTDTPILTPTDTSIPGQTPTPTDTQVPTPTDTPIPSPTPTDTPVPTPTDTPTTGQTPTGTPTAGP